MANREVKILKDTIAAGKFVKKGEVIEVAAVDAHLLTNIGRATYSDRMMKPDDREQKVTVTTEPLEPAKKGKKK